MKYEKDKEKCPECNKRTVDRIIAYRKSFTPRNVKYFCNNTIKGVKCGFKAFTRLNHGEHDYFGGVKSY